jgi:hypothetical protein
MVLGAPLPDMGTAALINTDILKRAWDETSRGAPLFAQRLVAASFKLGSKMGIFDATAPMKGGQQR